MFAGNNKKLYRSYVTLVKTSGQEGAGEGKIVALKRRLCSCSKRAHSWHSNWPCKYSFNCNAVTSFYLTSLQLNPLSFHYKPVSCFTFRVRTGSFRQGRAPTTAAGHENRGVINVCERISAVATPYTWFYKGDSKCHQQILRRLSWLRFRQEPCTLGTLLNFQSLKLLI